MNSLVIKENPIAELKLPTGWFEDKPSFGPLPGAFKRVFHSHDTRTSEIFIWYRGMPVSTTCAVNFAQLLACSPQSLSDSKIQKINQVLGNMGQAALFKPLFMRTQLITEKNVLIVEGRWSNGHDALAIFIPESLGANKIIELHYQSPKEDFRKNLAAVNFAFSSIQWSAGDNVMEAFKSEKVQASEGRMAMNSGENPPAPPIKSSNTHEDWFGPSPEKLAENLEEIGARFGEKSSQYASTLVQIGDAHMVQGSRSNPKAQASYEKALEIFRTLGQESPETAWLYDKLANVKHSSGDYVGAQADLARAIEFWKKVENRGTGIDDRYIARRQEDLQRLDKIKQSLNRKL